MSRDFVNPGLSSSKTWVAVKEIPPVIDTFIKKDYKFNHYKAIAERAKELCEDWIQTNKKNGEGIEASVTCRAKEKTSLRQKLVMRHDEMKKDGGTGYQSTQEILTEIVDLAGVRIILYMPSETQQERVKEMIQDIFDKEVQPKVHSGSQRSRAAGGPRPADQEKQLRSSKSYEPTHLGYTAVHYRVAMMEKHGDRHYDHAEDDRVEIQVVSALGNAWAQAGHDVLYKTYAFGQPTNRERAILDALNGLVLSGDLLLEQFHELVRERTYKPFNNVHELANFLSTLDLLLCTRDCPKLDGDLELGILLGFLKTQKKNYPLVVRNAIKELGFPDEPTLDQVIQAFKPPGPRIKSSMCAMLCLIRNMVSDPPRTTPPGLYVPYSRKCRIMMKALYLLQELSIEAEEANRFLRRVYDSRLMNEAERKSIDFVLTDQYRNQMLTRDDTKETEKSDFVRTQDRDALEDAWNWFQKRATQVNCICGLVFRLAEMGAVKDFDSSNLIRNLTIGSIEIQEDEESTDGDEEGESTDGNTTEGAAEELSE